MNLLTSTLADAVLANDPCFWERQPDGWKALELTHAWRTAHDAAHDAYEYWRGQRDADGFAIYRAAQDRADRAQDELATHFRKPSTINRAPLPRVARSRA